MAAKKAKKIPGTTMPSTPKTKGKVVPLVGAAAAREWRAQTSPAGVKKKAASDLAALKKKYPGLYK